MLTRADLNETSPVCLFPTPRETITEVKLRIGGGRKIEIFGSGGAILLSQRIRGVIAHSPFLSSLRITNTKWQLNSVIL